MSHSFADRGRPVTFGAVSSTEGPQSAEPTPLPTAVASPVAAPASAGRRSVGWHLRRVIGDVGLKYRIAVAAVLLTILAVWIAGGFARADVPGVPDVGLRTSITAPPWRITVTDAAWVTSLPGAAVPDTKGDRLILVAAELESTATDEPSSWRNAVSLTDVPGLRDAEPMVAVRRDDETTIDDIGPGMPVKVIIVWEQDGSVPPPTSATFVAIGSTFRLDSFAQANAWLDPTPVAHVSVSPRPLDASATPTAAPVTP
jgi:hypothetical protein